LWVLSHSRANGPQRTAAVIGHVAIMPRSKLLALGIRDRPPNSGFPKSDGAAPPRCLIETVRTRSWNFVALSTLCVFGYKALKEKDILTRRHDLANAGISPEA
jgi:hypothetical protein